MAGQTLALAELGRLADEAGRLYKQMAAAAGRMNEDPAWVQQHEFLAKRVEALDEMRKTLVAHMHVPARRVLQDSYHSYKVQSNTTYATMRPYPAASCEFIRWRLDDAIMVKIIQDELEVALSGVMLPKPEYDNLCGAIAALHDDPQGTLRPITSAVELKYRFSTVLGKPVVAAINACLEAQGAGFPKLHFAVDDRAADESQPGFCVNRATAATTGGEGQMPHVMHYATDVLDSTHAAVRDSLLQACSNCVDKSWRFTFLTYFTGTFFIWRVAEHKYAVTDMFDNHHQMEGGLWAREMLFYIIWMSIKAPWGHDLPDGPLARKLQEYTNQEALKIVSKQQGGGATSEMRSSGQLQQQPQPQTEGGQAGVAAVQDQQQPGVARMEDAHCYPLEALQLTTTRLGEGQCGPVLKGRLEGLPVAVKATDVSKARHVLQLLWHEAQMYGHLATLQGQCIPILHGFGYWRGGGSFFLATSVVPGTPLDSCPEDAPCFQDVVKQALQAIHESKVAHGDVRADNILVEWQGDEPKVYWIDFGRAYLNPTPDQCEEELEELDLLFQELAGDMTE